MCRLALLVALLVAGIARAADEPVVQIPVAPKVWAWLEPRSTHAPVALPIPLAQRTEIAFGRYTPEGPELLKKGDVVPDATLLERARDLATPDLLLLKPRYVRDRQNVIQYAELRSPQPVVASAVLAPTFLQLFRETLGDTVLVVVPNRYTAYVFPQLASRYQEYFPMVFAAFGETAYPVSVEVFEFSATGIRAVGVYERP